MKRYSSTTRASSRRNWLSKRTRVLIIATSLALVLGLLLPRVTVFVAGAVLTPITAVERWVREGQSAVPTYVRDRATLEAERDALKEALAISAADQAALAVLRAENDTLRNQLQTASSSRIWATVLAQPPQLPYDRLVVNQGSRAGVVVGAPVFAGEYVAIGTVQATTPWQSVIELISSSGVESTVYVFGPDIYTTAVGQGGGILRIGVPQGIPMVAGNPVTTAAMGRGILGTISHIETETTRPEQYGYVSLPINIQSLQSVTIGSAAMSDTTFDDARAIVDAVREHYFTVPVPEGVLVDIPESATSTATSSAATTTPEV